MKMICYIFLSLTFLFLSCATRAVVAPLWTADVSTVFPNDAYIAQKSYGADKRGAETAALAALARFFKSNIETRATEVITVTDAGSQSTLTDETFVQSQIELFAVRYTEPWYNNDTGYWETVAYINRDEAWGIFEPKLAQKTNAFNALYDEAEKQTDSLTRILLYSKAAGFANRETILPMLEFAHILNPTGVFLYGETQARFSQIPAAIEKLKSVSGIYIASNAELDPAISAAFVDSFSGHGFLIERRKDAAMYTCTITFIENPQTQRAGTFYYPSVETNISGKSGTVYTYGRKLSRVGASTPDAAKRRAYTAMVHEIQKSFLAELAGD
jgi:hypothetical protein